MSIDIGSTVPAFELQATGGHQITQADLTGQYTVLYFYPKDSTPGCTTESQDFTRLHSIRHDCQIFGVSRDSLKSTITSKPKYEMPFELISDPDETLCTLFDVMKLKNMYGKQVRGVERSTFLIDPDGVVVEAWRKVKVPEHAETVLESLKARA